MKEGVIKSWRAHPKFEPKLMTGFVIYITPEPQCIYWETSSSKSKSESPALELLGVFNFSGDRMRIFSVSS